MVAITPMITVILSIEFLSIFNVCDPSFSDSVGVCKLASTDLLE